MPPGVLPACRHTAGGVRRSAPDELLYVTVDAPCDVCEVRRGGTPCRRTRATNGTTRAV